MTSRLVFQRLLAPSMLTLAALGALALAGCGGDGDDTSDHAGSPETPTAAASETQIFELGSIRIVGPSARANPNPTSALYMHLENSGSEPDRLVQVTCPLAGMTQLHETVVEGATSRMEPVEAIELPAQGHVDLKPGGTHVMLLELERPLEEGEEITCTLTFERAGSVEITAPVRSYAEAAEESDHSEH